MVQFMMTRCKYFDHSRRKYGHARPREMMLLIEFSHPQVTLNKSMASSTSVLNGLRYIHVNTQIINPIEERISILSNQINRIYCTLYYCGCIDKKIINAKFDHSLTNTKSTKKNLVCALVHDF